MTVHLLAGVADAEHTVCCGQATGGLPMGDTCTSTESLVSCPDRPLFKASASRLWLAEEPETASVTACCTALDPLSPETAHRVLDYLTARYTSDRPAASVPHDATEAARLADALGTNSPWIYDKGVDQSVCMFCGVTGGLSKDNPHTDACLHRQAGVWLKAKETE